MQGRKKEKAVTAVTVLYSSDAIQCDPKPAYFPTLVFVLMALVVL